MVRLASAIPVEARPRSPRSVSVLLPCRDNEDTLGAQLDALAAQTYDGSIEVIVIDNGSHDRSAAVASGRPGVRVVDASDGIGCGFARNRGASVASGELLLACDADDVVDPGWVAALVRGLEDADLVGGLIDFALLNPGLVLPEVDQDRLPMRFGFLPAASGGNFGIHADLLRSLGGWDESATHAIDDLDLCWRAQLAGYRLEFVPDAVVHVRMRATTDAAIDQGLSGGSRLGPTLRRYLRSGLPWEGIVVRGLALTGRLVITAPLAVVSRRHRRAWARTASIAAGFLRGFVSRSDRAA